MKLILRSERICLLFLSREVLSLLEEYRLENKVRTHFSTYWAEVKEILGEPIEEIEENDR